MTILVVDDSEVMRKIVIRSLRQAGYGDHDVEEAEDGVQGLEKAATFNPSVILSDWNMPNMNGLEFLRALRESASEIPFGFITSESSAEQKALAVAAGASFFIPKPFTTDDLVSQLSPFLSTP